RAWESIEYRPNPHAALPRGDFRDQTDDGMMTIVPKADRPGLSNLAPVGAVRRLRRWEQLRRQEISGVHLAQFRDDDPVGADRDRSAERVVERRGRIDSEFVINRDHQFLWRDRSVFRFFPLRG